MGLSEWLKAPPPVAAGTCFFFAALASARLVVEAQLLDLAHLVVVAARLPVELLLSRQSFSAAMARSTP